MRQGQIDGKNLVPKACQSLLKCLVRRRFCHARLCLRGLEPGLTDDRRRRVPKQKLGVLRCAGVIHAHFGLDHLCHGGKRCVGKLRSGCGAHRNLSSLTIG